MSRSNPLPVDAVIAFAEMVPDSARSPSLDGLVAWFSECQAFERPHVLRLLAARALWLANENELFAAVVNVAQAKQEHETVAK